MIRKLWRRWQAFRHRRFIAKGKPFKLVEMKMLGVFLVWNKETDEAVLHESIGYLLDSDTAKSYTDFLNNQWLLSHGHIELTTEMMANEPDPERRQELAKARLLYCLKKEDDDEVQN